MFASVQPLNDLYQELIEAGAYRAVVTLTKRRMELGDLSVYYHHALALGYLDDEDEALLAMESAWNLAKDPRALEYLSRELSGRDEMRRLEGILEEARSLGVSTPALRLLGDLYADQGRHSDAEEMFKAAIERGDEYALLDYAAFLHDRGRLDEALSLAHRALYLVGDKACWTVARVFLEQGKLIQARDAAIGAVREGYLGAAILWAQAAAAEGDDELAEACIEDAVADGVPDADAAMEAFRQGSLASPSKGTAPASVDS